MFLQQLLLVLLSVGFFSLVPGQMKDLYNCYDHFSSRNSTEAMPTHSNLCFMLTKCTEHVIRYQTNYSTALGQNVSCCKSFDEIYYQKSDSHCKIDCNIKCHKTTCSYRIRPGQGCRCNSGYIYSKTDDKCVAKCPRNCQSGKCSEPNKCLCLPGFVNLRNRCVPECPDSCTSTTGFCETPNACQCPPDFNLNPSGKSCSKIIEASKIVQVVIGNVKNSSVCNTSCKNGNCSFDDKCVCNEGFVLNEDETFCVPLCSHTCENGICITTNTCSCKKGYQPTENRFVCEPIDIPENSTTGLVLKSSYNNNTKHLVILFSICALVMCIVLRSAESQLFDKCKRKTKDQETIRENSGGRIIQWYGNVGYFTPSDSDKEFFV